LRRLNDGTPFPTPRFTILQIGRITGTVPSRVNPHPYFLPEEESLAPEPLQTLQRRKLAAMLESVRESNAFYRRKYAGLEFNAASDAISGLPFTTRAELEADQVAHPPFGTNLTFPLSSYCRFHQTSGSGGRPMRWLDTRAGTGS